MEKIIMEKIIEVKGCEDCHFYRFDENGIYFKSFCRLKLKKCESDSPEWCPLKENNIIFKFKTK